MRYRDITEAAPDAQANAQRTQRDKLTAANDKVAKASQTYQSTVRAAHDSAAAAKRKLAAPPKPPKSHSLMQVAGDRVSIAHGHLD
jgi:hypothetical protein